MKQAGGSKGEDTRENRCPLFRVILANRRFQRTLTAFAPLICRR
jgi:hypothetical protein